MEEQATADARRRLDALVGEWTIEASWPTGEKWPGGGHATFEWHPGGAHLVERTTVGLPEAPDSISIIGCDGSAGSFYQLYSDERGISRIYGMTIGDGEWRLWREAEPFSQRFLGTFGDDGNTITGRWEIADPGQDFAPDFDIVFRRSA